MANGAPGKRALATKLRVKCAIVSHDGTASQTVAPRVLLSGTPSAAPSTNGGKYEKTSSRVTSKGRL